VAGRLARLFRRREPEAVVLVDDGSLMRVGTAFDAARADSAVLAEMEAAGADLGAPVLLRHHLKLPDEAAVEEARRLLAQDGYATTAEPLEAGGFAVRPTRTQVLTALSAAQERSRMAGLAQRLGGDVDGWDALAPKPSPSGPPQPA
jgi:hypothetical protein